MKCTLDAIPSGNAFGLERICLDGRKVILVFKDGTSLSSELQQEFLAKEAMKGANRGRTYETYFAPVTDAMKERGISDLRIEENAVEDLTLLILEAPEKEESLTLQLGATPD